MHSAVTDRPVRILLVGAGGYGEWYLQALLADGMPRAFSLVGVVEPFPARCQRSRDLARAGVPIYLSLEEFFAWGDCDLAILASPIHLHCSQTCLALAHGSHVLSEKPLCASFRQIDQMQAAQLRSGRTVTVGYQWSFSPAIRRFKADILAGRFGRARRFRTLVAWPRDEVYYTRNAWSGRQTTSMGEPVLDSPANNAMAHFLHNMLYVLGDAPDTSTSAERVEAELWRANPIENYDTVALRIRVEQGAELLFYASHAVPREHGPFFVYEFERAVVHFEPVFRRIVATLDTGETVDYGSPDAEPYQKLWDAIDSASTGRSPVCGVAAAAAQTRCVILAQEAAGEIKNFSSSALRIDRRGQHALHYADGLLEMMERCYAKGKLFSEMMVAVLN